MLLELMINEVKQGRLLSADHELPLSRLQQTKLQFAKYV